MVYGLFYKWNCGFTCNREAKHCGQNFGFFVSQFSPAVCVCIENGLKCTSEYYIARTILASYYYNRVESGPHLLTHLMHREI